MEEIQYEGLMGILSENNKKQDAIQAICKAIDKKQINQSVSKEEIETIVKDKVTTVANYIELRLKQQTENQTEIFTTAINEVNKKVENLSVPQSVSFPQPKKIAFFGFEFLRTSVVIFCLSVTIFWSLVMNIKQMDNYQAMKTKCIQLTEYIQQIEQLEKQETKSKKAK